MYFILFIFILCIFVSSARSNKPHKNPAHDTWVSIYTSTFNVAIAYCGLNSYTALICVNERQRCIEETSSTWFEQCTRLFPVSPTFRTHNKSRTIQSYLLKVDHYLESNNMSKRRWVTYSDHVAWMRRGHHGNMTLVMWVECQRDQLDWWADSVIRSSQDAASSLYTETHGKLSTNATLH